MTRLAALLRKDLRALWRSPAQLAMLAVYPLLVAGLAALAVKGSQDAARIAVVNLDTPGATVRVGDQRFGVNDYIRRLRDDADVRLMGAPAARDALDSGDVDAVLTIPSGFIAALSSGVQQPHLRLDTNPRTPLEGDAITRRMQSAVYRFNQGLAARYVDQVVNLADLITNGGSLGVFGRSLDVIGLERSDELIRRVQAQAAAGGRRDISAQLDPLLVFIRQTQANLALVRPAATSIANPMVLDTPAGAGGRVALTAFGVAAAVLVSVALAGVLLGATGVAQERADGTLQRVRLAGVPAWGVVAVKAALAALASLVIGLVLLGAVALLADVPVGRWWAWVPALLAAGAACGALGALIGALVPDARSAVLVALLVALPLIFVGLVPSGVARGIASALPFGRAFDLFRDLLAAPSVAGRLALHLPLLAAMAAVCTAGAAVALGRRDDA